MRTYTIDSPGSRVEMGIRVAQCPDGQHAIAVGESGRGRTLALVPVVEWDGGEDELLASVQLGWVGDGPVVRPAPENSDQRAMVVIQATGQYSRGCNYKVHDPEGITILAEGVHAFGMAGRTGRGVEVVAVVEPGATFRLHSKYEEFVYTYRSPGDWLVQTQDEHDAAQVARSAAIRWDDAPTLMAEKWAEALGEDTQA